MKAIRFILVALEALLAVNAVGGGIYGLTGARTATSPSPTA